MVVQETFFGDLHTRYQGLHSGLSADSQKWLTWLWDPGLVKRNHAMQHMEPTVLFAWLLLLAQSDSLCPWAARAVPDELRHAGFLGFKSQARHQHRSAALSLWNFSAVTVRAFYATEIQKWNSIFSCIKVLLLLHTCKSGKMSKADVAHSLKNNLYSLKKRFWTTLIHWINKNDKTNWYNSTPQIFSKCYFMRLQA